jgi:glucan phosphoethanolaminetransferase (alkaline phosphatase superfamily)
LAAVLAMADLTLGGADPIDRPQPSSPATGWYFLVVCDTLGAQHMSAYGYGRKTTPFVDQFSEEAVVFDRAIAASSWTRPSVTSLLTSAPVRNHQMDAGSGPRSRHHGAHDRERNSLAR